MKFIKYGSQCGTTKNYDDVYLFQFSKTLKIVSFLIVIMTFLVTGCVQNEEVKIVKTYQITDSEMIQECFDNNQFVTMVEYSELSDGTWECDNIIYKYRLEISGRMGGAVKDSTFVYLSNVEDLSFEKAWKAAGGSSNMNDYFDVKDAKLVEMK